MKGKKVVIVKSKWNSEVTDALCNGAVEILRATGVEEQDLSICEVEGSFELIYGSARVLHSADIPDAIIALGCIVRGETPHFDYISQAVAVGLGQLNTLGRVPVIFGVLTTDTMQQALDRAGGKYGNKGHEAAITALRFMV